MARSSRDRLVSRRDLIAGSVATVASLSLTDWLAAQPSPATPRPKRSDVGSAEGKRMLGIFRRAVAEMQNETKWPLYHPFNWNFQANIHAYPDDTDIDRIFDQAQGNTAQQKSQIAAFKALAMGSSGKTRVWKTCSHFTTQTHFLTWHRMYLYFFERIVEKVAGEPFAIPYWPYAPDAQGKIKLPADFADAVVGGQPNLLHFSERNDDFVQGGLRSASEASHKIAYGENSLLVPPSGRFGFSARLDETPHGSIHAAVGTDKGMGTFEYAGRDPLFWVHHSNIDRLWESWRRPGADGQSAKDSVTGSPGKASWDRYTKFAFAGPGGERIEMTVNDALKASKSLGLAYDKLETLPVAMAFAEQVTPPGPPTALSKQQTTSTPQITAKDEPVSVTLDPAVAPPVSLGFAGKPATRYTLFVEAEASTMPGGAFEVYVNIPEETGSDRKVAHYLGTFNFFSGAGHGDGAHTPNARFDADVTDLVTRGLIDPRAPGDVTFRARYAKPKVPVTIKNVRIVAR